MPINNKYYTKSSTSGEIEGGSETSIYEIRNRGQLVNVACQWIVTHHKLTIQLAIKPIAILSAIELVNLIFIENILLTILIAIIALLLVPTVPSMAMYVAEHGDEFDYPNRTPKLMELWQLWKRFILSAVIMGVTGGVMSFLSSITMVGPYFIQEIMQVAMIIRHREEDTGFLQVMFKAFDMSFKNFISFLMMILGTVIISASMIVGPIMFIFFLTILITSMISQELMQMFLTNVGKEPLLYIIFEILAVGYILASMVTMIITHFFYGHCVECEKQKQSKA